MGWSGELMPAISGRQGEAHERNQGGEKKVRGREGVREMDGCFCFCCFRREIRERETRNVFFVKMESVFLLTRKGKHFPALQDSFFL